MVAVCIIDIDLTLFEKFSNFWFIPSHGSQEEFHFSPCLWFFVAISAFLIIKIRTFAQEKKVHASDFFMLVFIGIDLEI